MSKNDFNNDAAYNAARERLKGYPEYHDGADIPVLNLIMKREFAEAILKGEKKVEYRGYSPHYTDRLYDKETLHFMETHKDEPDLLVGCEPLRQVYKIHFHNYNNTWFLDVECTANVLVAATPENGEYFIREYGSADLKEMGDEFRKNPLHKGDAPLVFAFILGSVLDTNLPKP